MSGFLCIGARLVTFYANDAKGNTSVFLAIFQGDASSKRDTFSIRILATRFTFMVSRSQWLKITQKSIVLQFSTKLEPGLNGPNLDLKWTIVDLSGPKWNFLRPKMDLNGP